MKEAVLIIGLVALVLFSGCLDARNVELKGWDGLPTKNDGDGIEIEGYYSYGRFGGCVPSYSVAVPMIEDENSPYERHPIYLCDSRTEEYLDFIFLFLRKGENIDCASGKVSVKGAVRVDKFGTIERRAVEVSEWGCLELLDSLENCWNDCPIDYAIEIVKENREQAIELCRTEVVSHTKCFDSIAETVKDPSLCDYIKEEGNEKGLFPISREECISSVAQALADPMLCNQIENIIIRDGCYARVQVLMDAPDASLCEKVQDQSYRDDCYLDIALRTKDMSICEEILLDVQDKAACFTGFAIEMSDPSLCERAGYVSGYYYNKDFCYTEVARKTLNTDVCGFIQDSDRKETCYLLVTHARRVTDS